MTSRTTKPTKRLPAKTALSKVRRAHAQAKRLAPIFTPSDTAKPGARVWWGKDIDDRPEVVALLRAIQKRLPILKKLLDEYDSHWGYEDRIYRFYCGSFKIYYLQEATETIVKALKRLLPKRKLAESFTAIVKRGTGKTWEMSHNSRWDQETAPIVEAFFHARYFLDMAVRYGQELKFTPSMLPSGWAGLLCLYGLR